MFQQHKSVPNPPSPTLPLPAPFPAHFFHRPLGVRASALTLSCPKRSSYLSSPHPSALFADACGDSSRRSPRSFAFFCTQLQKSAAQLPQFQSFAASLQNPGDDVQNAPPNSTKGSLKNESANHAVNQPIGDRTILPTNHRPLHSSHS